MTFPKIFLLSATLLAVSNISFTKSHCGKNKYCGSSSSSSSSNSNSIYKNKSYEPVQEKTVPQGYIDGKRCDRTCDGTQRSCFFSFHLENFYSMSKACYNCPNVMSDCYRQDCIVAGGLRRTVWVVNRQLPGPPIMVCEGDEVIVHLQNSLMTGEGTTIHWHGQHMKRNKYMDGVPYVTQCPIPYNNKFTYEYSAENPGTYWWHSHIELQRGDGVYGAMIVRQPPSENPHANSYDFDLSEHVIMISDWNNRPKLESYESSKLAGGFLEPTGILINGYGYQSSSNVTNTPAANFVVRRGNRYRFRLINVGFFDCPLEISIDGHRMTIIATDSHDLQPFEVDSFISNSGERFDFVLNANQTASSYYIRVKGYLTCERLNTFTVATLRYEGSLNATPAARYPSYATAAPHGGVIYNPISIANAIGYTRVIGIHQPKALQPLQYGLNTKNVCKYYIIMNPSQINHPTYHRYPYYGYYQVDASMRIKTPQFNRITNVLLDVPLLPARFEINQSIFCNEETMHNQDCANTFCACPHVISVPENAVVEFVFIELSEQDGSTKLHQIHLHGHSFRVLAWGEIGRNLTRDQVIRMDQSGQLRRNFINPPIKDTVSVPQGGYTIVRFRADNNGYWVMHCHVDAHASLGMQLVLKVGKDGDMPPVPHNFPKCGNWPKY